MVSQLSHIMAIILTSSLPPDFCWVCLEGWGSHKGYYDCSKYKETDDKEKNIARQALQRYIFYYQRVSLLILYVMFHTTLPPSPFSLQWANHHHSLKLEETTRQKILGRIHDKVAASSGTWIDWQYLLDAADLLRKVGSDCCTVSVLHDACLLCCSAATH